VCPIGGGDDPGGAAVFPDAGKGFPRANLTFPAAGAIPADAKPTGTATAQGRFQTLIEWVKGRFDGVDIETQREGESTWTYLAFDSFSPYLDTQPPAVAGKPEVRPYRNKENRVGGGAT
jgi:hypothetical protein